MQQFNLKAFVEAYSLFSASTLDGLLEFYHRDVAFIDPVHRTDGRAELERYFRQMAQGLIDCRFQFDDLTQTDDQVFLAWTMHLRHRQLRSGQTVTVSGFSHLKLRDDLVEYHRDYYDLGEMLYEQIPLLGPMIGWLKRRLAGESSNSVQASHARQRGTAYEH